MHAIKLYLLLLLSLVSCEELFYIYDWAEIATASFSARYTGEITKNYENFGAGPLINASTGSYLTNQYQLFPLIYHRALTDPRRTLDPSKATTFLIPYDMSTDMAFYYYNKDIKRIFYEIRKCILGPDVSSLLQASPWFHRHQGSDHVLIISHNYAMEHYLLKPKCKSLLQLCTNCTKFSIDDYSFLCPVNASECVSSKGRHWNAVPFPSNIHWSSAVQRPFLWENEHRPILVSYVGAFDGFWQTAMKLRKAVRHFCALHEACIHRYYASAKSRNTRQVMFENNSRDPHEEISMHSVFCIQPVGDLFTRKGLFDSMLHGCLPVTFHPLTATAMYTRHIPETLWKKITIEFPMAAVSNRSLDFVSALMELVEKEPEGIRERQRLLRELVFRLQYGMEHFSAGSSWPLDSAGKPIPDAYDILMDWALGWSSGRVSRSRNATVPECWHHGTVVNNECVCLYGLTKSGLRCLEPHPARQGYTL